ncbi:hypothetical protein [Actinomadura bangladeshensis]|uniref:Uncharacterized protein n=1 Tax=Actinomadura bangladeshensis TaxID=453573 RepID=A0A6L9QAV5_9ACTN|nr:hypothetical protein [Actinomadura bangladeshensis]NEA22192.1 hypothetical protein [Actinomadura bangladeshensis]
MNAVLNGREVDAAALCKEIERRCPGVMAWFGSYTFHWWAMVWVGRWRLVEASTPRELLTKIQAGRSAPPAGR